MLHGTCQYNDHYTHSGRSLLLCDTSARTVQCPCIPVIPYCSVTQPLHDVYNETTNTCGAVDAVRKNELY